MPQITRLSDERGSYQTRNRIWDEYRDGINLTMLCPGCGEWQALFRGNLCPGCVECWIAEGEDIGNND